MAAWDLTGITTTAAATFNTTTSGEFIVPSGIAISVDGTKFFTAGPADTGSNGDHTLEYDLGTAGNIDTAVFNSVLYDGYRAGLGEQPTTSNWNSMAFNSDGTKMYLCELSISSSDAIYQYSLSTAYDLGSVSYDSVQLNVFTANSESVPTGISFGDNGLRLYVVGSTNDEVFSYTLSSAYDISTASDDSISLDISGATTGPTGLAFNDIGTLCMVLGGVPNIEVYTFTLSTAWNVSTGTVTNTFTDNSATFAPRDLIFSSDGSKMYITTPLLGVETVRQYTVSAPANTSFKLYVGGRQYNLDNTTGDKGKISVQTYVDGGVARLTFSELTEMHCLEGLTVPVVLDGNVEEDYTVVDGKFTVRDSRSITRASVGRAYTTDIETLNIEVPSPPSTIQDKVKKITDVMIRFYKSRMPFIGPNKNDMIELKGREAEKLGAATDLFTGDKSVNIPPSWNTNGRLFIRMRKPVPLTVLGIFPEMTVEDDL